MSETLGFFASMQGSHLVTHVKKTSRGCFTHMHDLRHIQGNTSFLELHYCTVTVLCNSWLHYFNSLFISIFKSKMRKTQCVQNSLARIILNSKRIYGTTPVLKDLQWLLVEECSFFKTQNSDSGIQVPSHWFSRLFQPLPKYHVLVTLDAANLAEIT